MQISEIVSLSTFNIYNSTCWYVFIQFNFRKLIVSHDFKTRDFKLFILSYFILFFKSLANRIKSVRKTFHDEKFIFLKFTQFEFLNKYLNMYCIREFISIVLLANLIHFLVSIDVYPLKSKKKMFFSWLVNFFFRHNHIFPLSYCVLLFQIYFSSPDFLTNRKINFYS